MGLVILNQAGTCILKKQGMCECLRRDAKDARGGYLAK